MAGPNEDFDETVRLPRGSVPQPAGVWGTTGQAPPPPPPAPSVRHAYPLVARDPSLTAAFGLLMQSLPYALMRLAILFGASVAGIVWLCVAFGGAAWLGTHIASAFGWVWLIACILGTGFLWGTVLRYVLNLIECGHVAVLTELITKGSVGNGSESMFAYGKRVVIERFGQVNVLYGLNMLVRGVLGAFHRTLDFVADLLPIPGLETLSSLVNIVLRAATRYLDKVIFSYNLARGDENPWRSSQEGLIYYAQNAKPILKTAIWVVILERVLTFLLWVVLMVPAGLVTLILPESVRETGGLVTVIIAALFAASLRASFLKPLFLIMMMVRFHSAAEGQAINEAWDARLSQISDKFRELGQNVMNPTGRPATI